MESVVGYDITNVGLHANYVRIITFFAVICVLFHFQFCIDPKKGGESNNTATAMIINIMNCN